jgi:hypothetical protein
VEGTYRGILDGNVLAITWRDWEEQRQAHAFRPRFKIETYEAGCYDVVVMYIDKSTQETKILWAGSVLNTELTDTWNYDGGQHYNGSKLWWWDQTKAVQNQLRLVAQCRLNWGSLAPYSRLVDSPSYLRTVHWAERTRKRFFSTKSHTNKNRTNSNQHSTHTLRVTTVFYYPVTCFGLHGHLQGYH